jgi:hypothetical protein
MSYICICGLRTGEHRGERKRWLSFRQLRVVCDYDESLLLSAIADCGPGNAGERKRWLSFRQLRVVCDYDERLLLFSQFGTPSL